MVAALISNSFQRRNLDPALPFPRLREIIDRLRGQPGPGAAPSHLFKADGHFRRDAGVAVDDAGQGMARHAQPHRAFRDRKIERIEAGNLDRAAGMRRVLHSHVITF